jgi:hypothetical protein
LVAPFRLTIPRAARRRAVTIPIVVDEDPGYVSAWQRYRRWARLRLVACVGFLPIGAAIGHVCKWAGVPAVMPAVLFPWFGFVVVTLIVPTTVTCPRCGNTFFFTWWWSNPLARRCVHCGLPKWATSDPDQ